MKQQHLPLVSCGTSTDIIRKCLCSAYFHHAARLKGINSYVDMRTGVPAAVHPTSAIASLGFTPDYLVYHQIIATGKVCWSGEERGICAHR